LSTDQCIWTKGHGESHPADQCENASGVTNLHQLVQLYAWLLRGEPGSVVRYQVGLLNGETKHRCCEANLDRREARSQEQLRVPETAHEKTVHDLTKAQWEFKPGCDTSLQLNSRLPSQMIPQPPSQPQPPHASKAHGQVSFRSCPPLAFSYL